MKKLFMFAAAALLAVGFTACKDNNNTTEPDPDPQVDPQGEVIEINIEDQNYIIWTDNSATAGWWQLRAQDETYYITLSNADGVDPTQTTYGVEDLDDDFSFVAILATEEEIHFSDGELKLTITDEKVIAKGEFVGSDKNTYKINIEYLLPVAPEVTQEVEVAIADGFASDYYVSTYGLWVLYGSAESGEYAELYFVANEEGGFTSQLYLAALYADAEDEDSEIELFSSELTNVDQTETALIFYVDMLSEEGVLYHVTLTINLGGEEEEDEEEEGGEEAPARKAPAKNFKGFQKARRF